MANKLKLIIANKKYSSWSMRPWIALKAKDIQFEEELSQFDEYTNHAHFWEFSPTKKVPVLQHETQTIWETLSILEYVAELYPNKGLWPTDRADRAHARCVANEMHAGFPDLRVECPMNMARTPSKIVLTEEALTDLRRVDKIWADCLEKYGGPFLFGEFNIADAMFAPLVSRIETYEIPKTPAMEAYCTAIKALPAFQAWDIAGKAEPWICPHMEI